MKALFLILVTLLVGCSPARNANMQTDANVDGQLENVENCFYAATFLLQREPEGNDDWEAFLKEATRIVDNGGEPYDGIFDNLCWSVDGGSLLTFGGRTIDCTVVSRNHDTYRSEGTEFLTTYCLTVDGTEHSPTFIVEMSSRK